MSKELEALERVWQDIGIGNNFREDFKDLDTIKKALQRLEVIDNSKPSEAMRELSRIEYNISYLLNDCDINEEVDMNFKSIVEHKSCEVIEQAIIKSQEQKELLKSGDLSDGYHTFNQLYYQRCVLFASLVRLNKDKSWKSFKHSDGKYCFDSNGEWFIVGIDTPIGSYTYHYEKKYWDLFECQELECGKEWDGHTEEDVTRLLSLPNEQEKVLNLLFEKQVDIYYLIECKNVKEYNAHWCYEKFFLTEEQFDLVRRLAGVK